MSATFLFGAHAMQVSQRHNTSEFLIGVSQFGWSLLGNICPGDTGVVAVLLPQAGASSHLILDHGPMAFARLESNPDTGLGNMFARGLWQKWQGFHRLGLHQYTLRWAAWFGPEHQRWQKCEKIIVRLTILLWPSWLSKSETWFYSPLLRCSVQSMWRCACSWRKAVW